MPYERPVVLSIAGYDPSGGAGVLADIKAFEQHRCLGMAAVTAWTVQTEDKFFQWTPMTAEQILSQVEPLLEQYAIQWVKIGLCPGPELLLTLLRRLKERFPQLRIIWDPVLSASAGFSFVTAIQESLLATIAAHIYLVTPNVPEAMLLSGAADEMKAGEGLARYTNVLLKGGHSESVRGTDRLWTEGRQVALPPGTRIVYNKHGSGCILSAAITANLAHGLTLEHACREGKKYVEQVLRSNTQLLAYHVA
ncbi:hydroxymethylpyrimidine/phosphomethylpyrimidine kinase [Taibaiella koreensis]|uniref:hydroxymethylpyrimidine/phosphomethylpyrimidine kinase n=1 Tax=Taibaiella koreensis TaxID=1268548 RepID=UPI000E59970D|nr:hydroxymethylpyrimidine/phosphomethylpyrimidine kinase [Taibaiella koreensis]